MAESSLREKVVFLQAIDLPAGERAVFLSRECGSDDALRRRLEAMLAAATSPDSFLERPAAELAGTLEALASSHASRPPDRLSSGTRVGPYKLLERIGDGGMGVVYMAEQQQPVRRTVALKLIKPGMDSAQVIARFEAERQALALMDHPHIARVLDAGAAADGRPYFVMELVKGIPITRYCDEHHFTPRERLALMIPVCQAVQHAHQKGVIHRDIKPSNVLVANYDGKPVPKVIDFGVAKAVGQPLTDRTLVTGFGSVLGTLEYMSPEQAEFNALDIDTRSDIYSLGVLLYELLTGSTPLTRMRLKGAALLEALRMIREEEPPRPSTRLSESRDDLPSISAQRKLEPARLTKEVRGELDWIVMKALEKDRTRRYETAAGLGRDIERFLREEAVEACPPSTAYRLKTFVRRNRRPVLAAGLIFMALVAGIMGTSWGLVRARAAERDALIQSAEANNARLRASEAEKDAKADRDKSLTAEGRAKQDRDKAMSAEAAAKADRDKALAAEADTEAFSNFLVFEVLAAARPRGVQGGLGINVTVVEALEAAEKSIPEAFEDLPRAEATARHGIGVTWRTLSRYQDAERNLRRALELREKELGPSAKQTLFSLNSLGVTLSQDGRTNAAIPILKDALQRHRKILGEADRETMVCMDNLAVAYQEDGRVAEGIKLSEQVVELHKEHLGIDNPDTLIAMNNLAVAYSRGNRFTESTKLKEEVLERSRKTLEDDHPSTLRAMANLGMTYLDADRFSEALPLMEDAYVKSVVVLGAQHQETLLRLNNVATAHFRMNAGERAIPLLERVLAEQRKSRGEKHPELLVTLQNLAANYASAGKITDLQRVMKDYLELAKGLPDQELATAGTLALVSYWLVTKDEFSAAEPYLRDSLKLRERLESELWTTFNTRSLLGAVLVSQEKYAEAEPLLVGGYTGIKDHAEQIPPPLRPVRLTEAVQRLVKLYDAWGKSEDSAKWRKTLEELSKEN